MEIKKLKSDSDQGINDASFYGTVFASFTLKSNLIVCIHLIGTQAQGAVNDQASLARHSKRLQDELSKRSPDQEVIKELMDAEFSARRSFITKIDVRTRKRDTLAKYHILGIGSEVFLKKCYDCCAHL